MIVTNEFNMDLALPGAPPVVHAVQGDNCSRKLVFHLYSNGAAWEPPEGTTAIVGYQKADGTGGSYDTMPDGSAAWNIVSYLLTVQLAPQVCAAAGTVSLAVSLINGETQISTFRVKICVQARPGAAASEDYYNVTGFVPASGWEAGMYLGTDESGKVVAMEAPTAAEVAVEDVLDAMPAVTHWEAVEGENSVTINYSTDDGEAHTDVIHFDANGYPVSIVVDGRDIPGSWTAAEEAATDG